MACVISSARPLRGHFSRAFKSMGLAPSCLLKLSAGDGAMTPSGGKKNRLVPRRQRVFSSRLNARAHAEQRTNQGDLKLRPVTDLVSSIKNLRKAAKVHLRLPILPREPRRI